MLITTVAVVAFASSAAKLVAIKPDLEFPAPGATITRTFGPFEAGIEFNEAIVSWNIEHPQVAAIKVEARALGPDHTTKWYTLGDWAADTKLHPRESVNHQADGDGTVDTDTLRLKKPGQALEISVTLQTLAEGATPRLKFLSVSFADTKIKSADQPIESSAWGKTIDVPERAQNNYPNGGVLCSATSVSMMLWHYSKQLNRPELDHDVPDVQAGVWDSVYKGAGNWPFNTAYAGSFEGLRAYVARLNAISDLEKWIDAGLPVVTSVSFDMLRGKPLSPTESGHLVVLVGFTSTGDPVINDPAFAGHVRKVYPRADFEKAWLYSHRTVYLIYPETAKLPEDPNHLWASG
jgi:hypothetical protein